LDIKAAGSLKVQRCPLVTNSFEACSNSNEQASSHPIIVYEADDLEANTGLVEAPENSENVEGFQHGPAHGKFLKRYSS